MVTPRRSLLSLIATGLAALLLPGKSAQASADSASQADQQLQGTWLVVGTPAGAQPGGPPRLLVSFTSDGLALRTAPYQLAAPPALGVSKMFISPTHGEWQRTGDREFALMFVGFAFDADGNFLAMQRIRVAPKLNETLDTFSGPFTTDFIGADGNVIVSSSGTVQGMRMRIEPMS
jgi:hypothetical protein